MPAAQDAFIEWVTTECEDRHWSWNYASEKAGLARSSISAWVNREKRPGIKSCTAIAKLFNRPPEYVLYLTGHLPAPPEASGHDPNVAEIAYRIQRHSHPVRERLIASISSLIDMCDAVQEEIAKVRIIGEEE